MLYGQLAVFAEYERSLISERTKAGMAAAKARGVDLPPEAPSFITRVCGFGFHILRRQFGQAPSRCLLHKQLSGSGRARSPQIAQALGALLQVFGFLEMSAA